ncbi:MAG: TonB-dependent siderophore receptor [Rhodanobacteraceae bacterium]
MKQLLTCTVFLLALGGVPTAAMADGPASAQSTATPLATIKVQASTDDPSAGIGSIDGASLHDSPLSVQVIDRRQMDATQPRTLSEVARADAATTDNYAPVGYYQNLAIRGFALDLASGYRMNGLSIAGEQRIALENKQSVQILKGLAGIEAGVVAPGGLVNFVSKRPAEVRQIGFATDARGSRQATIDIGTWLTPEFGIRLNAAWDNPHSYVDHVRGRRNLYALAMDWQPSDRVVLRLDSEYQSSAQRSVSGFQLLGGTALPARPHSTWMLGYQPWQQPVGIRSTNSSARLAWQFDKHWKLRLAAGHSRSVIQDNVAFAYGCYYTAACASGEYPGNFFGPDGSYDIYDFRSPDDTRRNSEARALIEGRFSTGPLRHELTAGVDAIRRTIDQRPYVNAYVGSANIDQRDPPVFAPSSAQAGPSARRLSNWQRSLLAADRMHIGQHWQVLAGARLVRMHERTYDDSGVSERQSRLSRSLPQAAVLWSPDAALAAYLSYSESISLGQQAPFWTSNDGSILAPVVSRQTEAGIKWLAARPFNLSAALFRIHRPYQFARPDDTAAGYTFVQQGQAVHSGVELGAHGQVSENLRVDASAAWIRGRAENTGIAAYEGHQIVNVPAMRVALLGEYRLRALPGLDLLAGLRYASPNPARPDNATRTPAYTLFDAGLRYQTAFHDQTVTWHLMASNLFNRFYWRDTGSAYGDAYLFPGAPRQVRLSVNWSF